MATLSTLSPFKDNPHKIARSPEFRVIPLVHLSHFFFFFSIVFMLFNHIVLSPMTDYQCVTNLSPNRFPVLRPHICHFFSTNVLLGSIFLHMKALKLRQKFPKFPKISPNVEKFSISPQLPYMES